MRYILILLIMLSSCQYYNLRSKIASQKADLLYAKHDFDEALRYYQLASRLNPKDTKYLKLAKCYQQIEDKNAEIDNLQKAFANEELTLADKLRLANLYKVNGLLDSARAMYRTLSIQNAANDAYFQKQIEFIDSIEIIQKEKIKLAQLAPKINSKQDDVQPFISGDTLFFCSNRTSMFNKTSDAPDKLPYYQIYETSTDTLNPSATVKMPQKSILNSVLKEYVNLSAITTTKGGTKIYFSSASNKKSPSDSIFRLKMYTVAKDSNNSWSKPHTFIMNKMPYSFGHPFVVHDESMFFFSSDMPGGYGGTDIWACFNIDHQWSDPVNLGSVVNTPGNEIYPFYHSSGKLYFGSDYHPGYGGWDIHYAAEENGDWKEVINAGSGINSVGDEISIYLNSSEKTVYFTANRSSGLGGFDIYYLKK